MLVGVLHPDLCYGSEKEWAVTVSFREAAVHKTFRWDQIITDSSYFVFKSKFDLTS